MGIESLSRVQPGDKVTMVTFTGMNLGQFVVDTCDDETIVVTTRKDNVAFSRKTGLQVDSKKPKYANRIVDLMEQPKRVPRGKSKKKKVNSKIDLEDLEETTEENDFEDFD